tara:strand:+ start:344 stop:706 length:363 start_codon:yes stop_codon:yes gene_type:complete
MNEEIKTNVLAVLNKLDDVKKIPNYIYVTMEFVEKYKQLKGVEKKNLVISVVKDIIHHSDLDEDKKTYGLVMLDSGIFENMIDLVVDAASGKLEINMEDAIYGGSKCLAANCIACIKLKQ